MQRTKIDSKLIRSVGYDSLACVLEIEFVPKTGQQTGKVYRYFKVEREKAEALMSDKSVGSYFLAKIKGEYEYRKVDPEEAPQVEA